MKDEKKSRLPFIPQPSSLIPEKALPPNASTAGGHPARLLPCHAPPRAAVNQCAHRGRNLAQGQARSVARCRNVQWGNRSRKRVNPWRGTRHFKSGFQTRKGVRLLADQKGPERTKSESKFIPFSSAAAARPRPPADARCSAARPPDGSAPHPRTSQDAGKVGLS